MRPLIPLLLGLLALGACRCKCPPPAPDAGSRDLARPADLAMPADFSSAPDLSCIKCDAVINPCPALGFSCNPVSGCCDSAPH